MGFLERCFPGCPRNVDGNYFMGRTTLRDATHMRELVAVAVGVDCSKAFSGACITSIITRVVAGLGRQRRWWRW